MIKLTQDDLKKIEQRHVIGTETGTPIVELAEWERDALCAIARVVLPARKGSTAAAANKFHADALDPDAV